MTCDALTDLVLILYFFMYGDPERGGKYVLKVIKIVTDYICNVIVAVILIDFFVVIQ